MLNEFGSFSFDMIDMTILVLFFQYALFFFMLKVFDNLCCNLMIISEKNYLPKVSKYIFISAFTDFNH